MAGKNHHIVPRFAQRGFLAEPARKKSAEKTWVFRKSNTFLTGLGGSGAESYYYGSSDYTEIDELITEAENREYSVTWNRLRAAPPGGVAADGIPSLIAHFELRSRHLRESLRSLGSCTKELLTSKVNDVEWVREQLRKKLYRTPWEIIPAESGILKRLIGGLILAAMPRRIKDEVISGTCAQFREVMTGAISRLNIDTLSKKGHLATLKRELPTPTRASAYKELEFRIEQFGVDAPLIQGDSVAIFIATDGSHPTPLLASEKQLSHVFIPLARNKLLIGGDGPTPTAAELRGMAARCSHTQYIAHAKFGEACALQSVLGEWASPFTENELSELFQLALQKVWR